MRPINHVLVVGSYKVRAHRHGGKSCEFRYNPFRHNPNIPGEALKPAD